MLRFSCRIVVAAFGRAIAGARSRSVKRLRLMSITRKNGVSWFWSRAILQQIRTQEWLCYGIEKFVSSERTKRATALRALIFALRSRTMRAVKIILTSVGKAHEPELRDAIDGFSKRLSHYFPCEWRILPPAKNAGSSAEIVQRIEAETVLKSLHKDDFLVLLDERGTQMTSPDLAKLIQERANRSVKNVVFLIGGAFGVDQIVQARANFTWSLSKLVFPHQIARLILAEQLYRAATILRNESYHHQ